MSARNLLLRFISSGKDKPSQLVFRDDLSLNLLRPKIHEPYIFTWDIPLKRLVPGLKNMPVPVLVTLKIRYTNRKAPAQRPFLLAGELASPAGRVLVVLGLLLGRFTCKI